MVVKADVLVCQFDCSLNGLELVFGKARRHALAGVHGGNMAGFDVNSKSLPQKLSRQNKVKGTVENSAGEQ